MAHSTQPMQSLKTLLLAIQGRILDWMTCQRKDRWGLDVLDEAVGAAYELCKLKAGWKHGSNLESQANTVMGCQTGMYF